MPSKSASQHRLMEAAAHTPGGYGGVPQKVGKDYVKADAGRPKTKTMTGRHNHGANRPKAGY